MVMMTPHYQGRLDGLCGVYSIINALHAKLNWSSADAKEAFTFLCKEINLVDGRLHEVIVDGMGPKLLGHLLDRLSAEFLAKRNVPLARKFAFRTAPASNLKEYWDRLESHLALEGAFSVILRLAGRYDHWTVVAGMSSRSIEVFDSDMLKRISRRYSTVSDACDSGRIHHLSPTQTFLLSF